MNIYALGDTHLSFGSEKPMDIFGWGDHATCIKENWLKEVKEDDIVLIPGDFSWAINFEELMPDAKFVGELPGKKILIKGNHDYWWSSYTKVKDILEPLNIYAIQNNAIKVGDVVIGGTRLWVISNNNSPDADKKIYRRELLRLEMTLNEMKKLYQEGDRAILMLHYPPFNVDLKTSEVTDLIDKYDLVNVVIYGHLHGKNSKRIGEFKINNAKYLLTACDFLNFKPLNITKYL